MAKYTGKSMSFKFGALTIPSGDLISVDWPQVRDELEATGATQLDKEYFPSERSSTITINFWDAAAGTNRSPFLTTTAEGAVEFFPQGNTSGKPKLTANAFVTNLSAPLTHNQVAAVTVTLRVNGATTETTVSP